MRDDLRETSSFARENPRILPLLLAYGALWWCLSGSRRARRPHSTM